MYLTHLVFIHSFFCSLLLLFLFLHSPFLPSYSSFFLLPGSKPVCPFSLYSARFSSLGFYPSFFYSPFSASPFYNLLCVFSQNYLMFHPSFIFPKS